MSALSSATSTNSRLPSLGAAAVGDANHWSASTTYGLSCKPAGRSSTGVPSTDLGSRIVTVTQSGYAGLTEWLGVDLRRLRADAAA